MPFRIIIILMIKQIPPGSGCFFCFSAPEYQINIAHGMTTGSVIKTSAFMRGFLRISFGT